MMSRSPRLNPEETERIYTGEYFDSIYDYHWFINNQRKFRERNENILRMLEPQREDVILEVGCSTGPTTRYIARMARKVIGIDFSPIAVEKARAKSAEEGVDNTEFHVADVSDMSCIPDNQIDKVVAIDLVEHIYDNVLIGMFRECYRVLRQGGTLSILTPNRNHYVEVLKAHNFILKQFPSHIAVRRPEEIKEVLISSGAPFDIDMEYFFSNAYPVFRLLDKAFMGLPLIGPWFRWRYCLRLRKPSCGGQGTV
ncbi:MAG: methyltransferase domain-containing protein [Deltaproteobacteria bacterium]|nr:methyltransferase domain-containing protein [Deltaproteobacteria bacterium]